MASLDGATRHARSGLALAVQRQAAGEADMLEVAAARVSLALARLRADNARAEAVREAARLFKALGGGWTEAAAVEAHP